MGRCQQVVPKGRVEKGNATMAIIRDAEGMGHPQEVFEPSEADLDRALLAEQLLEMALSMRDMEEA